MPGFAWAIFSQRAGAKLSKHLAHSVCRAGMSASEVNTLMGRPRTCNGHPGDALLALGVLHAVCTIVPQFPCLDCKANHEYTRLLLLAGVFAPVG